MRAYVRACVSPHVRTSAHVCVRASVHACICASVYACVRVCVRACGHTLSGYYANYPAALAGTFMRADDVPLTSRKRVPDTRETQRWCVVTHQSWCVRAHSAGASEGTALVCRKDTRDMAQKDRNI